MTTGEAPGRPELRWLLRLLGDPWVVRALSEHSGPPWPMSLEGVIAALPADAEHTEASRATASRWLSAWMACPPVHPPPGIGATPTRATGLPHQYLRVVSHLMALEGDDVHELSHYRAIPDLFRPAAPSARQAPGFVETHCHFRGAAPYEHLWYAWRCDLRHRGVLKRHPFRLDPERSDDITWGELIDRALAGSAGPGSTAATLQDVTLHEVIQRLRAHPVLPTSMVLPLARYLSVCIGLRVHLLHQRGLAGLDHFVRTFERYSGAQRARRRQSARRPGSDEALMRAVLTKFRRQGVAAIELRPTLDSRRALVLAKFRRLINAYEAHENRAAVPSILLGLVPSLFKQEGFADGDPIDSARQQALWSQQTRLLLRLLETQPQLRYYIVGLDAAGSEQGCPPRLFAPAAALVHDYNRRHGVSRQRPGRMIVARRDDRADVSYVRLGLTMHAGEDFVDPMTGLRHIWEALTALDLRDGDRLGHALAAGLDGRPDEPGGQLHALLDRRACDPRDATVRLEGGCYRVAKPLGVHLLDLAWQLDMLPGYRPEGTARVASTLSRMYADPGFGLAADPRLSRVIAPLTVPLQAAHFPRAGHVAPEQRVWIALDAHWDARFVELQRRVLDEIRHRDVVVESCPTSNIAVAGLSDHLVHRFHRAGVRVTVATDDPAIFGAFPADELERLPIRPSDGLSTLSRAAAIVASQRAAFVRWPAPAEPPDERHGAIGEREPR